MRIIPVIDLKSGQAVRAVKGDRDRYQPIVTPLAQTSNPLDVANGLRTLHPFGTFYIADLDAIERRALNTQPVSRLLGMTPPPSLWLDAGLSDRPAFEAALQAGSVYPVLGTESQIDDALLAQLRHHPRLILSLDFFADGYRGPSTILDRPDNWPSTVIVMTLARVGAAAGPDLERLAEIKSRADARTIVAAGGVRNAHDLHSLSAIGIEAALIATSLHDGTITAAQLAVFDD